MNTLKDIIRDEIITFKDEDQWTEQVVDDKLLDNVCEQIKKFMDNNL